MEPILTNTIITIATPEHSTNLPFLSPSLK